MHSHLSNSRIHFSVLCKQISKLLSDLSNSRIDFGIFRKQKGYLLSQFADLLSGLSNSRNHITTCVSSKSDWKFTDLGQSIKKSFKLKNINPNRLIAPSRGNGE